MPDSASEIDDSRLSGIDNRDRRTQTWTFRDCVPLKAGQWPNNFEPNECTQGAAEELSCHSISSLTGMCRVTADSAAGLKSQYYEAVYLDGFVHASTSIWLG